MTCRRPAGQLARLGEKRSATAQIFRWRGQAIERNNSRSPKSGSERVWCRARGWPAHRARPQHNAGNRSPSAGVPSGLRVRTAALQCRSSQGIRGPTCRAGTGSAGWPCAALWLDKPTGYGLAGSAGEPARQASNQVVPRRGGSASCCACFHVETRDSGAHGRLSDAITGSGFTSGSARAEPLRYVARMRASAEAVFLRSRLLSGHKPLGEGLLFRCPDFTLWRSQT